MEKIIIKNFGPIKDIELEIKDINVFIGSTSSGKSTVAKLIAISREFELFQTSSLKSFVDKVRHYNIDFDITRNTYIKCYSNKYYWELKHNTLKDNFPFAEVSDARKIALDAAYNEYLLMRKALENVMREQEGMDLIKVLMISSSILNFTEKSHEELDEKKYETFLSLIEKINEDRHQIVHSGDYNSIEFERLFKDVGEIFKLIYGDLNREETVYIPAERILLSMVAESLFGLMNNDVAIAKCIKDFGSQFESARKKPNGFSIPFLNIEYNYYDKSNFITFNDGAKVKLEQASSGLQSIIPLLLVLEVNTKSEGIIKNCFVIEEPELNLYPTIQKELIEFIVERINKSKDKLIVTTHSPYVLTSLDNLIQASNAAKADPEQKEKVAEIVPEEKWVDFDRVACYYFEDGTCRSTLDTENQTIGASNIDDVSEELGKTFDELLELKYANVS